MKKALNIIANVIFWFALYAIGAGIWYYIAASGLLAPDVVWKILRGAI